MSFQVATFDQLDAPTLYALLRLREQVFVVEQRCPYADIDGRDVEPDTRHVWLEEDGELRGYLRILTDPDGAARIGRVCVAAPARGAGVAHHLMAHALELIGPRPCVLDAQTYLAGFYAGLGFAASGPEFVEDGIPHVPMRRAATEAPRPVPRSSAAGR